MITDRNDEASIAEYSDMLEKSVEDNMNKLEQDINEMNSNIRTKLEEILDNAEKV